MYCKLFTSQQVYDGMTEMNIACDNAMVTDGWICLYRGEQFVASFDMTTINGWVLIDSTADTPQTERRTDRDGDVWEWRGDAWYCIGQADTPQTDCKTCRHYKLACELFSEVCKYEPITQTETQNTNLTFDTPQTDCGWGEPITVSHNEDKED